MRWWVYGCGVGFNMISQTRNIGLVGFNMFNGDWTLYLGLLNEFYPTGKVLTISVYFVAASDCFLITFRFFCAKQVSNPTTRCHEQCINTIQYPLKCGCESRSRCTTVTLADVLNIGMGLGTPIFTLLWSSSRPSPGISSAGVEPVRGAA